MARGRHYAKLSLSNAPRLSFSDLCILLFLFLSLCRFFFFFFFFFFCVCVCVCVFIKLHITAQSGLVIYSFYATVCNPPGGYLS